ncbi:MAG: hypothetical protein R3F49_17690 [Planctomycetota bacterium]
MNEIGAEPRIDPRAPTVYGVLAALEEELGPLRVWAAEHGGQRVRSLGVTLERSVSALGHAGPPAEVLVARSGVGKVAAAHGAAALLAAGAQAILVVGTCGGLDRQTPVGALVHCGRALQWDLAVRQGRELLPDAALLAAWLVVAPGSVGQMLTADRPAIRLLERWRRARAVRREGARPARMPGGRPGELLPWSAVADMETAAVAAVAARAGVPWAALRAVTDSARVGDAGAFLKHLPTQGGRAAATVPMLLREITCRRLAAPNLDLP